MKISEAVKKSLEGDLTRHAKKDIKIDDSSNTNTLYAFVDEISMFRIAEKMRAMSNFSYGFSENLKTHFISLSI